MGAGENNDLRVQLNLSLAVKNGCIRVEFLRAIDNSIVSCPYTQRTPTYSVLLVYGIHHWPTTPPRYSGNRPINENPVSHVHVIVGCVYYITRHICTRPYACPFLFHRLGAMCVFHPDLHHEVGVPSARCTRKRLENTAGDICCLWATRRATTCVIKTTAFSK